MMITDWKGIAVIVGGVLVLTLIAQKKAGQVIDQAIEKDLNITSQDNIAYRSVSGLVDVLDDGDDNNSATLGTMIYDWLHPDETF